MAFDESWEMHYGALEEYTEANGGKCPPTRYTHSMGEGNADLKLGSWCNTQRTSRKENQLSQERITKLNDIHFVWGDTETRAIEDAADPGCHAIKKEGASTRGPTLNNQTTQVPRCTDINIKESNKGHEIE